MQCLLDERYNEDKSNANHLNISKTCCIVGNSFLTDTDSIKPFLMGEIKKLLAEGYTNFITYFRSSINHCMVEILSELNQFSENKAYIELVLISYAYFHWTSPNEQKKFIRLAELCDKAGYIDIRQTS